MEIKTQYLPYESLAFPNRIKATIENHSTEYVLILSDGVPRASKHRAAADALATSIGEVVKERTYLSVQTCTYTTGENNENI